MQKTRATLRWTGLTAVGLRRGHYSNVVEMPFRFLAKTWGEERTGIEFRRATVDNSAQRDDACASSTTALRALVI